MENNTQQTNPIPTWEEMEQSREWDDYGSMARAYAKLHVKACKEAILETGAIISTKAVDAAYPDSLIK